MSMHKGLFRSVVLNPSPWTYSVESAEGVWVSPRAFRLPLIRSEDHAVNQIQNKIEKYI